MKPAARQHRVATPEGTGTEGALDVQGPFLRVAGQRYLVRGVTYGTFGRAHPDLLPDTARVDTDFRAIARAGFNTVRTYTEPRPEVLDLAVEHRLRLLVGIWWQDLLHHGAPSRATFRQVARQAREAVHGVAGRCAGHPAVLGLVVGNEIPAGAVRWYGPRRVERLLRELRHSGKDADPGCLLGYANYPTTGYLDTSCFDFDCLNVFLEDEAAFARYLGHLRAARIERPLLLTELGLDSRRHGERRQAAAVDWQLRDSYAAGVAGTFVFSWTDDWSVAGRAVPDWAFGLTRADRSPKSALPTATRRHDVGLLGTRERWPRVSVVVCAYQAEATLGECLASLERVDYPDYEVIVVDDGSTDATAAIAAGYPVRLFTDGHRGLSGARNLGLRHATGDVVAYLDADAFAEPDWLAYLVIGLEPPGTVGVGGPNVVPPDDPPLTQAIFRAPGGPVPVLVDDTEAEHVPGCNMAFRAAALREVGGFDPVYRTAGDDADVCWKLLDSGHRIAFHPAALVWHHPRGSVRAFWRQQVGYGRAEGLLARRHPARFSEGGHARWSGTVYPPPSPLRLPGRRYTGSFGEAPYQRLYGGASLPMRRALGLLAVLAVLALLLLVAVPAAGLLAVAAPAVLLAAVLAESRHAARRAGLRALRWTVVIALLHLLQPVAREIGRRRQRRKPISRALEPDGDAAFPPARRFGWGRYVVDGVTGEQRPAMLLDLHGRLAGTGLHAGVGGVWDGSDLRGRAGPCWQLRITSVEVTGIVHLRLALRPRVPAPAVGVLTAAACWVSWGPGVALGVTAVLIGGGAVEGARLARRARRALSGSGSRG